jgi:hypothetical protein
MQTQETPPRYVLMQADFLFEGTDPGVIHITFRGER